MCRAPHALVLLFFLLENKIITREVFETVAHGGGLVL